MKLSLILLVAFLAAQEVSSLAARPPKVPKKGEDQGPPPKEQPLPKDPEVPEDDNESLKEFDTRNNAIDDRKPEEKAKAEKNLKRVEAEVIENNKKFREGKSSHTEKVYSNADEDPEQIKREHEGYNPEADKVPAGQSRSRGLIPPERNYNTPEEQAVLDEAYAKMVEERGSLPATYGGIYTAAKNQKTCGSCAAFAATGLVESAMLRQYNWLANWFRKYTQHKLDFSEQHFLDCAYGKHNANGCNGAGAESYPKWLASKDWNEGAGFGNQLLHEGQYAYLDSSPTLHCGNAKPLTPWSPGLKVESHNVDYDPTDDQIKRAVYNKGAVLTAMDADPIGNYNGGVFASCGTGGNLNHAVLIVGWGPGYWLVKNSWADSWGEQGLIKISNRKHWYRGQAVRQCLLGSVIVWVGIGYSSRQFLEVPPKIQETYNPGTALTCDVSKYTNTWFGTTDPKVGKEYKFTGWKDDCSGYRYVHSVVKCKNNICEPFKPGPSNACNYMFGRVDCANQG